MHCSSGSAEAPRKGRVKYSRKVPTVREGGTAKWGGMDWKFRQVQPFSPLLLGSPGAPQNMGLSRDCLRFSTSVPCVNFNAVFPRHYEIHTTRTANEPYTSIDLGHARHLRVPQGMLAADAVPDPDRCPSIPPSQLVQPNPGPWPRRLVVCRGGGACSSSSAGGRADCVLASRLRYETC